MWCARVDYDDDYDDYDNDDDDDDDGDDVMYIIITVAIGSGGR